MAVFVSQRTHDVIHGHYWSYFAVDLGRRDMPAVFWKYMTRQVTDLGSLTSSAMHHSGGGGNDEKCNSVGFLPLTLC